MYSISRDQNMSAVYLYSFQGPYQKSAVTSEEQKVFRRKKKKK